MKNWVIPVLLTKMFLVGSIVPAEAQQVLIKARDGSANLQGILLPGDRESFVIQTAAGVITVPRERVDCIGAACPAVKKEPADVIVHGSDTVGEKLFPLIVAGYARDLQAGVGRIEDLGDDKTELVIQTDGGTGLDLFSVEVQAAGSSTGFRSLIAEQAHIAMSSRPARATEVAAIARQGRGNLLDLSQEYIVAVDSILTVVSPNNPVSGLTVEQMSDIFSGRIQNWAEVGGPNQKLTVYTRNADSGTRGVFASKILDPFNLQMSSSAIEVGGNREMAERVVSDPGGIGYVGFASLGNAKSIDLIASCGIKMSATKFAAKTEEYPLERRLRLFSDNRALSKEAQGLLEFAVSSKADGSVREAGFIDLSVSVRAQGESSLDFDFRDYEDEPQALGYLSTMISDLTNANRLSTTFRFETASARLDNKAQRDIVRVIDFLAKSENAGREVVFAGYTDSVGPFAANVGLSKSRADAALRAVLAHPDSRRLGKVKFRTAGYGELLPVACNDSDDGRRRNRRVELWLR